ncbi:MAG TPA: AAA family ATPase [Caulobacteraceae bacterium]|jgi:pilus assembly protein CpaE|nr:AAA family ATPase [Caulobacteraceae bacterium]
MSALKAFEINEPQAAQGYFMAAVADDTTTAMIRGVARDMGWADPIMRDGGAVSLISFIQSTEAPAVLVVDLHDMALPTATADVKALRELCGPDTCLLAMGLTNDIRYYRQLVDAGARDYLVKPITAEMLREVIRTQVSGHEPAAEADQDSKSIAFIGARGGVGATTLAISLAWALAQEQQKVAMLDLDLHFGSAALSLDLEPGRGLRELLTHPDRIDRLLIDAAANEAGERFRLLSAEEPLEETLEFTPEGLSAIVHDLAATSNYLIVDVPRDLSVLSRNMLANAAKVVVVTDLSLPAMRDTQRLLGMIRLMRKSHPPMIVANRVGGVAGEIAVKEFERAIGAEVAHSIPYDRQAATAAAEMAKPLVQVARNSKTLAALKGLSGAFLAGEAASGAVKATPKAKRTLWR